MWYRCYPDISEERWRDMYRSYYPYLFDHGDKMSLYPRIPENPREWQPNQLLTTYDAIREDKYDAFMQLRKKFPELYQDTNAWDSPPAFGDFNMMYSVRLGLLGVKAFSAVEYDEHGNRMELTAVWVPDNQVIEHQTKETHGRDRVRVGAMNVPVEFHKPYVTAAYKAMRVPVKHVNTSFAITPDAFVPVGTKLDVRHFKVGQEVSLAFQNTDYGYQGVMYRHGHDGGPVWLGDSKWQRRPGGIGTEGAKRVLPGTRMAGNLGGNVGRRAHVPVYRIDFKNSLIYLAVKLDCDIGAYIQLRDSVNMFGKVLWSENRGLPPFPTFIPPADEDLGALATEDCQLVSLPLYSRMMDEPDTTALISQQDIDDARAVKPSTAPPKKKLYDYNKYLDYRKKLRKFQRARRKKIMVSVRAKMAVKQDATRQKKLRERRRVK
jgi:ribosomal protein L3